MNYQRLGYKFRYYWRKICLFLGFCPKCGNRVNYTCSGRAICPQCGK